MQKFQKIKDNVFAVFVIIVIAIFGFHYFTVTTNEKGFLGMDKLGRQIFIQTINHYVSRTDDNVKVTSDWEDFSFLKRLWQEPMRTTLRIYKTMDKDEYIKFRIAVGFADIIPSRDLEASLETPYKDFLHNYTSEINMTDEYSVTLKELEEFADEASVVTYRDLLRGFGFKNYEYYVNGELKSSIILNPNVSNQTESYLTTVGSSGNKPIRK
jgi:hypothetical protein